MKDRSTDVLGGERDTTDLIALICIIWCNLVISYGSLKPLASVETSYGGGSFSGFFLTIGSGAVASENNG